MKGGYELYKLANTYRITFTWPPPPITNAVSDGGIYQNG